MSNITGRMCRLIAAAALTAGFATACQDENPPQPATPAPPSIRVDVEVSLAGVPDNQLKTIRTCLEEIQKLMPDLIRSLGWNLEGKTITIKLENLGASDGAETLPGADANSIVIRLSRRICGWQESLRRRVLAHELDHARTLDDPTHGDGTKTRRQLRAEAEAANRAMNNSPANATTQERIRLKREQLRTEIAYLKARIREEERAYTATDTYGPGLGIAEGDLTENRAEKARALQEMQRELEKLQKTLASLGG